MLGPLGAHVRGQYGQTTQAVAERKTRRSRNRAGSGRSGPGLELEYFEMLAGRHEYSLIDIAALQSSFVRSPSVEDIMVVPHHHGGHARHDRGNRGLRPSADITAVEIKIIR